MARIGGGPRGRREPSGGAQALSGGGGLIARLFGGSAPAPSDRVWRARDIRRVRDLPDHLLDDIGLPPRGAGARYRRG